MTNSSEFYVVKLTCNGKEECFLDGVNYSLAKENYDYLKSIRERNSKYQFASKASFELQHRNVPLKMHYELTLLKVTGQGSIKTGEILLKEEYNENNFYL